MFVTALIFLFLMKLFIKINFYPPKNITKRKLTVGKFQLQSVCNNCSSVVAANYHFRQLFIENKLLTLDVQFK